MKITRYKMDRKWIQQEIFLFSPQKNDKKPFEIFGSRGWVKHPDVSNVELSLQDWDYLRESKKRSSDLRDAKKDAKDGIPVKRYE